MKNLFAFMLLLGSVCTGCGGSSPQPVIHFIPLVSSHFNFSADSSFAVPDGKAWEARKRAHDSCMGESFPANAIFIKSKDTFQIGAIVNRNTMKVVRTFNMANIPRDLLSGAFNFVTKPCYEKSVVPVSPAVFINEHIVLSVPGAANKVNEELNTAFQNSVQTEMETGSWLNIELTDAFGKILDTTTNALLLDYKNYLLDSANMVLIKSASITDVNFYITTAKPMSAPLLAALIQKPVVDMGNPLLHAQLFYISNTSFQLKFNSIFQIMGQFMQCKVE